MPDPDMLILHLLLLELELLLFPRVSSTSTGAETEAEAEGFSVVRDIITYPVVNSFKCTIPATTSTWVVQYSQTQFVYCLNYTS